MTLNSDSPIILSTLLEFVFRKTNFTLDKRIKIN